VCHSSYTELDDKLGAMPFIEFTVGGTCFAAPSHPSRISDKFRHLVGSINGIMACCSVALAFYDNSIF